MTLMDAGLQIATLSAQPTAIAEIDSETNSQTGKVQLFFAIQSPAASDTHCSLAGFAQWIVHCDSAFDEAFSTCRDDDKGLARRMTHSPAMLFKQTYHPHFSLEQRLRAYLRVVGPLASPVSPACLEDRPVQSAPDRRFANFVVEPRTSTWV